MHARAGRWRGAMVAVKVVAHDRSMASLAETLRESALSTSIVHPNVVREAGRHRGIGFCPCLQQATWQSAISGVAFFHAA